MTHDSPVKPELLALAANSRRLANKSDSPTLALAVNGRHLDPKMKSIYRDGKTAAEICACRRVHELPQPNLPYALA